MRSTIDIDEKLLDEAKVLTKAKTKKEVVNLSLKELIRKKKRERLAVLFGSLVLDLELEDVERLRKDEF
ncbi:type II toxin-antitoxin system VapB family antitoxin [Patescibacteria group bacterium]|nr:type II toxin-antitoxin system VapB family antitoxin [Patescibacteria group bacterium]